VHSALGRQLVGTLYERVVMHNFNSRGVLPVPHDDSHVHAVGPDPDRILIIGGGGVSGVGVTSHELGLGGHLARKLSAMTGRGVDVELIGAPGMTLVQAAAIIARANLAHFDCLVVGLGVKESLTLEPADSWGRDMRAMLAVVAERAHGTLSTFVVGITPLPSFVPLSKSIGAMSRRAAEGLNAETERACAEAGVSYIPFMPREVGAEGFGNSDTYAAWAAPIADYMYGALKDAGGSRTAVIADEQERLRALQSLGVDGSEDPALEAIAQVAKDLFGVDAALVNFIDENMHWTKTAVGMPRLDLPRDESFCSTTVTDSALVVSEDTELDPRFSHLEAVENGIRFYAGYPILAPNGQAIGAFCIVDNRPRKFSGADGALLREMALRVQKVLWRNSGLVTYS